MDVILKIRTLTSRIAVGSEGEAKKCRVSPFRNDGSPFIVIKNDQRIRIHGTLIKRHGNGNGIVVHAQKFSIQLCDITLRHARVLLHEKQALSPDLRR